MRIRAARPVKTCACCSRGSDTAGRTNVPPAARTRAAATLASAVPGAPRSGTRVRCDAASAVATRAFAASRRGAGSGAASGICSAGGNAPPENSNSRATSDGTRSAVSHSAAPVPPWPTISPCDSRGCAGSKQCSSCSGSSQSRCASASVGLVRVASFRQLAITGPAALSTLGSRASASTKHSTGERSSCSTTQPKEPRESPPAGGGSAARRSLR